MKSGILQENFNGQFRRTVGFWTGSKEGLLNEHYSEKGNDMEW